MKTLPLEIISYLSVLPGASKIRAGIPLIVEDIEKSAGRFRTILVLTERKAHLDILNLYPWKMRDAVYITNVLIEMVRN